MPFSHLSSYTKRLTDKVYRGRLLSSHSLSASNKESTTSTTGTLSTDDMTNSGLSSDRDEIISMDSSSGRDDGGGGGGQLNGVACDGLAGENVPTPSAAFSASQSESLPDSSPQMTQKDIQFIPDDGEEEIPNGEMSSAHDLSLVTMDESTRSSSTSSGASTTSGTSANSSSTSSDSGITTSSSSSSSDSSDSSSSDGNDPMLRVTSDILDVIGGSGLDGTSFDAVVVDNEEEDEEEGNDDDDDMEDDGSSPSIGNPQTSQMPRAFLPTIPNLVEDDSCDLVHDQTAKEALLDDSPITTTTNPRESDTHDDDDDDDDDYKTRRNRRLEALQAGRMERKKLLEENSLSKKMGSPTYLCMEDHPYALAQHERKLQELEQRRRKLHVVCNSGEQETTPATSNNEMASSHAMDEKVLDELVSAHKVIHHQRLYTQYLELQVRKAGVDDLPIPVRLDEELNAERNEARLVKSLQAELVKQQRDHAEEVLMLRNRITNDAWNYELRIRELERRLKAAKV